MRFNEGGLEEQDKTSYLEHASLNHTTTSVILDAQSYITNFRRTHHNVMVAIRRRLSISLSLRLPPENSIYKASPFASWQDVYSELKEKTLH